jgi:hypothetical protein
MKIWTLAVILGVGALLGPPLTSAEERPMVFFITSQGMGNGADLGGLAGADAHCAKLATAAGVGDRLWRAYLRTKDGNKRGVFARARIARARGTTQKAI